MLNLLSMRLWNLLKSKRSTSTSLLSFQILSLIKETLKVFELFLNCFHWFVQFYRRIDQENQSSSCTNQLSVPRNRNIKTTLIQLISLEKFTFCLFLKIILYFWNLLSLVSFFVCLNSKWVKVVFSLSLSTFVRPFWRECHLTCVHESIVPQFVLPKMASFLRLGWWLWVSGDSNERVNHELCGFGWPDKNF